MARLPCVVWLASTTRLQLTGTSVEVVCYLSLALPRQKQRVLWLSEREEMQGDDLPYCPCQQGTSAVVLGVEEQIKSHGAV